MYAIIETGGKQYRVQEGDVICVEKLGKEADEKVVFDKVLAMGEGSSVEIGAPYVGKNVYGYVVENGKGKKVIIFKYKSKKDYRKKQGHRQPYTLVEITGIGEDKPRIVKELVEEVAEAVELAAEAVEVAEVVKEAEEVAEAASVAEAIEAAVEAEVAGEMAKKSLKAMKKDELIAYAKEKGIEIDEKATKPVILEAIEEAEK